MLSRRPTVNSHGWTQMSHLYQDFISQSPGRLSSDIGQSLRFISKISPVNVLYSMERANVTGTNTADHVASSSQATVSFFIKPQCLCVLNTTRDNKVNSTSIPLLTIPYHHILRHYGSLHQYQTASNRRVHHLQRSLQRPAPPSRSTMPPHLRARMYQEMAP